MIADMFQHIRRWFLGDTTPPEVKESYALARQFLEHIQKIDTTYGNAGRAVVVLTSDDHDLEGWISLLVSLSIGEVAQGHPPVLTEEGLVRVLALRKKIRAIVAESREVTKDSTERMIAIVDEFERLLPFSHQETPLHDVNVAQAILKRVHDDV